MVTQAQIEQWWDRKTREEHEILSQRMGRKEDPGLYPSQEEIALLGIEVVAEIMAEETKTTEVSAPKMVTSEWKVSVLFQSIDGELWNKVKTLQKRRHLRKEQVFEEALRLWLEKNPVVLA